MIRWPHRREARPLEPKLRVNPRTLELETANQILEEVFHARPSDVEDMIQKRLEEKSWREGSWQAEEELWPERFCAGE
ncbi:Uncharacterised protein [uncultured archaeon]|nr:Uncharacterised protein [uncultured archaeon]